MTLEEARRTLTELGRELAPAEGRVRLDLTGPVARVELDNPGSRNAITLGMMVELADAVQALQGWPGAAVILQAREPRVFCAGGHLGQVRRAVDGPEPARAMALAMTAVLDRFLALPQVSVVALGGAAIGGGAEIATAADFRVATPSARIHFVHASLGIAPGWGGTGRLVQHLGSRAALGILARGASLSADEAARFGLVDAIGPSELEAAEALLAPMLSHPPEAVRALKAQVSAARRGDRAAEADAFAAVWGGPAHVAALDARRKR